jgi:hypothetical protein
MWIVLPAVLLAACHVSLGKKTISLTYLRWISICCTGEKNKVYNLTWSFLPFVPDFTPIKSHWIPTMRGSVTPSVCEWYEGPQNSGLSHARQVICYCATPHSFLFILRCLTKLPRLVGNFWSFYLSSKAQGPEFKPKCGVVGNRVRNWSSAV